MASKLGIVRAEVWNKYGSLKAWSLKSILAYKDFKINHPPSKYGLPSKLWERTITNVVDDIHASQCAAKEKVIKYIYRNYTDDSERTRLCKLLDTTEWLSHPKLHKWMRKAYKRGHTKVQNQIIYTPNEYTTFERNGKTWINVQSLERGKRIAIPLNSYYDLAGKNLILIIRNERVEVHFAVFQEINPPINDNRPCAIGIDRGFTEVYVTSNSEFIGTGLGEIITTASEYRNLIGIRRNKLRAIAQKAKASCNIALVKRIEQNNLGKKKWDSRERRFKGKIKTLAYTAAHQVCKQAKKIVYKDLTLESNLAKSSFKSYSTVAIGYGGLSKLL